MVPNPISSWATLKPCRKPSRCVPDDTAFPALRFRYDAIGQKIAARLALGRPISVHDYIEACLYDCECGYYRTKAAIGRGGDFVTAPEISQVFGEFIGLWAGEVWRQMGEPAPVRLVELGPGRGTLMADAIRALKVVPGFLAAATLHLVETSKTLQDAQRVSLAQAPVRIVWHDDLDIPDGPAS